MSKEESILVVDDDKIICSHLRAGLQEEYIVTAVNTGAEALRQMRKNPFKLVILDLILPDIKGIDLMTDMTSEHPGTVFIVLTGHASMDSAIEALKSGAYDYIFKPFDINHLKVVVKRAFERQRLAERNLELIGKLETEKLKLEVIMEAYTRMGEIYDLSVLSDYVTERVLQIAEAEKSSIMVIDESTGDLVLTGSKGFDAPPKALRVKIGDLVAGWVAKEGEALLVRDIDTDPRFKLQRARSYKTKSFISLPLKMDSRVVGVMNVTDKLAHTLVFTEEDLRYLSLIAHQTVIQIENIRLCEKLSSLAVSDPLTGIFNHRYFQEQLNVELLRAKRYKHDLSVIMFDIDNFKTYNDRLGHQEGDRVLKFVAGSMKDHVREVDIVCRYGGDEFVIILPFTSKKGALFVAQKIREAVEKANFSTREGRKSFTVTLSGGVAVYNAGISREKLISFADKALYRSKSTGRNRISVSDTEEQTIDTKGKP